MVNSGKFVLPVDAFVASALNGRQDAGIRYYRYAGAMTLNPESQNNIHGAAVTMWLSHSVYPFSYVHAAR